MNERRYKGRSALGADVFFLLIGILFSVLSMGVVVVLWFSRPEEGSWLGPLLLVVGSLWIYPFLVATGYYGEWTFTRHLVGLALSAIPVINWVLLGRGLLIWFDDLRGRSEQKLPWREGKIKVRIGCTVIVAWLLIVNVISVIAGEKESFGCSGFLLLFLLLVLIGLLIRGGIDDDNH